MVRTSGEDDTERKILDDIADYGWHCLNIMAEGEEVEYSFTIGLAHSYGGSELIVFGLPAKVAHSILAIAAGLAKNGTLDLARPCDELIKDYSCCFVEVLRSNYEEYVGSARWYYQGNDFPLHQIVWPSRQGLLPWNAEASPEFRVAQPLIADTTGFV